MAQVSPPGGLSRAEAPNASFVDDYRIGVGDQIRVIVFKEDRLSGQFGVNANGKIAYPLIGDVDATGLTTAALAATIQMKLKDGYLRDPKVSAEVLTYRPYFILGEVKTPAQFPYVNGMTVTNAIATAGGFTPRADRKKVFIRRSGQAEEQRFLLTPDLRVFPGDTIRLSERLF
ncbi:polysaccharide biosynthesis/export family protein [Novosphingobium sp.]|uniref:polysaccharide biosynthesis/export family protein n=1 Tax=Novosphingobium sp. TaxID=1874826 RepID=UPI003D0A60E0